MALGATRALMLGLLAAVSTGQSERPITTARAVLAVYAEDWGLASAGAPGLIVAVRGDGHAVWSENQLKGGPPFYGGQVSSNRVASLLARLDKDGLFADKRLAQVNFGPDSHFTSLLVRTAGKELLMRSWHEWARMKAAPSQPLQVSSL